jgi:hypothetical protein
VKALSRLEIVRALPGEFGQEIVLLPWWRALVAAIEDPAVLMLLVLLIRQSGKSQAMLNNAVAEMLVRDRAHVLFVAASSDQAVTIYQRKLVGPLTTLLRKWNMADAVTFTKRGATVEESGSVLEIVAPNEATGTGRTPTMLVVDEARDVPDEVFTAFAPSVIGAGGKVLLGSSAGAPKGFFYELVAQAEREPSPEVWLHRGGTTNENPHADQRMLNFLKKQIGLVNPAAMRRELENDFAEGGDELVPLPLIEAAIDDRLGELPGHDCEAFAFYDLSRRRDLTSRTVVVVTPARKPEAADHLVVASMRTWDPKALPGREVPFEEVREDMAALPRRFPRLRRVLVDTGAESSSLLPWAQKHPLLAMRVEPFVAGVGSNMDMWSSLVARFNAQTISIPRSERLLLELKSLRREEFQFGSKFRVVDSSRKYHRDLSLTLAGACFAHSSQAPDPGPTVAVIMPDNGTASGPAAGFWREKYFRQ